MNIGFIGLGIMGEAMCANIIKKHDGKVFLYDLDGEKVERLVSLGGFACNGSAELAEKSDVIITMVPKSEHSRSVYETVLPVLDSSKTCIDMSTIDPAVSVEISENVKAVGARFADAPVARFRHAEIMVVFEISDRRVVQKRRHGGVDVIGTAVVDDNDLQVPLPDVFLLQCGVDCVCDIFFCVVRRDDDRDEHAIRCLLCLSFKIRATDASVCPLLFVILVRWSGCRRHPLIFLSGTGS